MNTTIFRALNKKFASSAIVLLSVIFLFSSCGSKDKKVELEKLKKQKDEISAKIKALESELSANEKVGSNAYQVSTNELKKDTFRHFLEVQGRIDGEENVGVVPEMMGVITKIYVKEGDAVSKGQVLAELDATAIKLGLEELKSTAKFVTDIYNKQKNLWDQKIGSEMQYLNAKNNKESIDNKIKTLEEQLDMMIVRSPINGTVEEILIKVGQAASPQSPLPVMRVVNFTKVKVISDIAESYVANVKKGNPVIVYLPDLKKELKSEINFTSRYINPVNRTFFTEVRLNQTGDVDFKANMIAVLKIIDYSNPAAISVPVNLIRTEGNTKFVFVAEGSGSDLIARKKIVTVGQSYNGLVEILSGLAEGDKVITIGFQNVIDGQKIKN